MRIPLHLTDAGVVYDDSPAIVVRASAQGGEVSGYPRAGAL
ncbi:MAG TPA: hypothetical protein VEQ63_01965 [Bryobacteraceae bacterium]|nr:hypothetical protein [Bryobacteraceae bacterium]